MTVRCRIFALPLVLLWTPSLFAQPKTGPITVQVDASEAGRRFLRTTVDIPSAPGPLTLYYPKWIPGEHGPTGPIIDLAGLKFKAAGKDIPWRRDEVEMYTFHCVVPEGAKGVEVTLDFLSPNATAGFSSGASLTNKLGVINWNQVILYPKGPPARAILCKAGIRLPNGWKLGSSLTIAGHTGNDTDFVPVSLETLIDSPVICGAYLKEIPIGPADGPPHFVVVAADSAAAVEMSEAVKKNMDRLIVEAGKLFGTRHYKSYRFLFALSDQVAHFGLEHHESSDNRGPEGLLIEDRLKKNNWAQLLPHEYVHSWNGKYRRPVEMVTATFQEPQKTKNLWVYEGLTQYLGVVLTARCGLWTPEQFRESLCRSPSGQKTSAADRGGPSKTRRWPPNSCTTCAATGRPGGAAPTSMTRVSCSGSTSTLSSATKPRGPSRWTIFAASSSAAPAAWRQFGPSRSTTW